MCTVFSKRLIACMVAAVVALTGVFCYSLTASAATSSLGQVIYMSTSLSQTFPKVNGLTRCEFGINGKGTQIVDRNPTYVTTGSWQPIEFNPSSSYTGCNTADVYLFFREDIIFKEQNMYRFSFTLKGNNSSQIGSMPYLQSIRLNIGSFTDKGYVEHLYVNPLSVYSNADGSNTYAVFDFYIKGKDIPLVYNPDEGFCFKFSYLSHTLVQAFVTMWIGLDTDPFTITEITDSELVADLTAQLTADAIGNIGDDIDLPDETDTVDKANDTMDKLTNVDKDYKVDTADVNKTLGISEDLFGDSNFTKGFGFIDDTVTRFIDSNQVMYLFYCTILGLGIAFAALGRSL